MNTYESISIIQTLFGLLENPISATLSHKLKTQYQLYLPTENELKV
ncbi:MAG: hypothetical protein MUE81_23245 [Thermoflexibacter sp.]|nr:hypothetical protein [Thermoflexibacter sp.]